MTNLPGSWSPAQAFAPLAAACGDRLTILRDGDVVRWSYEGRIVVVELRDDGSADAAFVDRPVLDAVSDGPAVPVYAAAAGSGYTLDRAGCTRMADDMQAFFCGAREPRFAFRTAYEVPHSA